MEKQNSKVTKGNDIRNIMPVGEEQPKQITPKDKIEMLSHQLGIVQNEIINAYRSANMLEMIGVDTGTDYFFNVPMFNIQNNLEAAHEAIEKYAEKLSALNEFIKPSNQ